MFESFDFLAIHFHFIFGILYFQRDLLLALEIQV